PTVFFEEDGACIAFDESVSMQWEVRELAEVAPPDLIRGMLEIAEGEARLRQTFVATEDGARVHHGIHDERESEACELAWSANFDGQCLSKDFLTIPSRWKADVDCTVPLVAVQKGCRPPRYTLPAGRLASLSSLSAGSTESVAQRLFEVASRYEGPAIQRQGFEGCNTESTAEFTALDFFEVGEEATPKSVPQSAAGVFGEGRLLLEDARNADYNRLFSSKATQFFDTISGQTCRPHKLCGGESVCIPSASDLAVPNTMWADPACTVPLISSESEFALVRADCDGGNGAALHRGTGIPHEGLTYTTFGIANGSCEKSGWRGRDAYLVTTELVTEHPFARLLAHDLSERGRL
ncbi:MAG: hypothetical protein MK135_13405, partial [Polyangiaceae bacterium]|nr:hypothetical protein [Polyangiaceae bacterium]